MRHANSLLLVGSFAAAAKTEYTTENNMKTSMNFESRNPATGELLATYPEHNKAEIEVRLQRAWDGWRHWSRTPLQERIAFLTLRFSSGHLKLLFSRRRFFRAFPKFRGCWTKWLFSRGDADGKRFRFRCEPQELHTVSETVAECFRSDSDPNTGFDG